MAVTPQIVKTYAAGDIGYTKQLVLSSSKYAYYLLLIISFPIIMNMKSILILWLGKEQVSSRYGCILYFDSYIWTYTGSGMSCNKGCSGDRKCEKIRDMGGMYNLVFYTNLLYLI